MTLGLLILLQKQMHSVRPISIHPRLHLNSCKSRIKTKKLQLMTRRAHTSETKYKKKTPQRAAIPKGCGQAGPKGTSVISSSFSLGLQPKGHSLFGWRHEPFFKKYSVVGGPNLGSIPPCGILRLMTVVWWSLYKSHLVPGLRLAEAAFLVVCSRLRLN